MSGEGWAAFVSSIMTLLVEKKLKLVLVREEDADRLTTIDHAFMGVDADGTMLDLPVVAPSDGSSMKTEGEHAVRP